MSKAFIAETIKRSTGLTGTDSVELTKVLIKAITGELKKRGRFTVPTFGTFKVTTLKAGKALNPRSGEQIRVKARKTVRFKASPNFRSTLTGR